MNTDEIVAALDGEIVRLQHARTLVAGLQGVPSRSVAQAEVSLRASSAIEPASSEPRKRRKMSADGKARIAAAQRARWARQKGFAETAPVKRSIPAKKTSAKALVAKPIVAKKTAISGRKGVPAPAPKAAAKRIPGKKTSAKTAIAKKRAGAVVRTPNPITTGTPEATE